MFPGTSRQSNLYPAIAVAIQSLLASSFTTSPWHMTNCRHQSEASTIRYDNARTEYASPPKPALDGPMRPFAFCSPCYVSLHRALRTSVLLLLLVIPFSSALAGGTASGSCLLVEIASKGKKITEMRQRATLWYLPDGQWAALDSRNHYVCSKQGLAYISFVDRLANYPAAVLPELEKPNGLSII